MITLPLSLTFFKCPTKGRTESSSFPSLKSKIETFQNARIKLAKHYLETQNLNEARQLIEKIPVSVERYELLADYFTKVNQPKTAISLYKQLNERLKTSKYDNQINALKK